MEDGVQEVCLISIFFDRGCPKPVPQSCNPAGFAGPVIKFLIGESSSQPGTTEKPVPFQLPVETPHGVKVLKMDSSTQKSLGILLHNYGIYP